MWAPQTIINNKYGRIVALIDMDCFYCQVEEQLNPALKGKPIIVQPLQYDDYGGGGIIALNYVARARGVKRSMRGDEAKKVCDDLELVRVPVVRGEADLSKYRNAGKQVAAVLQTFSPLMTRASVDEAYLDLTERVNNRLLAMNKGEYSLQPAALQNTFAVGYRDIGEYVQFVTNKVTKVIEDDDEELDCATDEDLDDIRKSDIKLLIASSIVNEIRATVKEKTGYECSAGIAHNKVLAKIVCGINKPNKQTLLPLKKIHEFYRTLPIRKVQGLGGKLGEKICMELNVEYMAELLQFSKDELQRQDEKNGQWLYNLARGIDIDNIVKPRLVPKSISCSKMFPRQNAIIDLPMLKHWLHEIATDVVERVEEDELDNNRRAKQMVVSFTQTINNSDISSSRTVNIPSIDNETIVNKAINVIMKNTAKFFKSGDDCKLNNPIKFLGFNVNKFENLNKPNKTIGDLFLKGQQKLAQISENEVSNAIEQASADFVESNLKCDNNNDNDIEILSPFLPNQLFESDDEGNTSDEENNTNIDIHENISSTITDIQLSPDLFEPSPNSPIPSTSFDIENLYTDHNDNETDTGIVMNKSKCNQCGKLLPESEIQIHADAHLAFQINQEQRAEFQNQLKRSHAPNTPIKKKQKTEKSSIDKYLVKKIETPKSTTSIECSVDTEKCTECGKDISVLDLFEHMDFHAAKRLHDELMKTEMKSNQNNNNSSLKKLNNNSSNKHSINKNKKSDKKTGKNTAVRNITAFFQSTG